MTTHKLPLLAALIVTLAVDLTPSRAQPAAHERTSLFSVQLANGPTVTDTIKGVLLEHDRPLTWDLLITGSKGKGQYTCELRSADRATLFHIQRMILEANDVTVSCSNASKSSRGGVLVDLDDPKGGSFVLGTDR